MYTAEDTVSVELIIKVVMIINNNRIDRRKSRFFSNLLTAPRTVSNTYAQVAGAQSCANHVQHVERSSHAACRVSRGTKGQLSY